MIKLVERSAAHTPFPFTPESPLPKEIVLKILSFLQRHDLFQLMQVNHAWKECAQNKQLWEKEIAVLSNDEQEAFPEISEKIRSLILATGRTVPLLDVPVKTANDFNCIAVSLMLEEAGLTPKGENTTQSIAGELDKKLRLYKDIQMGFTAAFFLYQLGLRSLDQPKKYAETLKEKYGDAKSLLHLALHFVEKGKIDEALNILEDNQDNWEFSQVIEEIVYTFCHESRFDESISLIKKYTSLKYFNSFNSTITVLTSACQAKDLYIAERVIDEVVSADKKAHHILTLLSSLQLTPQQTKQVVTKYQKILDQAESPQIHPYYIAFLIKLHVALGDVKRAWSTVVKAKSQDPSMLYVLRNAFKEHGLKKEKEKVEKLIFSRFTPGKLHEEISCQLSPSADTNEGSSNHRNVTDAFESRDVKKFLHAISLRFTPKSPLPKEIVLKILSFLKRHDLFQLMQVNHAWKECAQDAQLWEKEISLLSNMNDTVDVYRRYNPLWMQKDLSFQNDMIEFILQDIRVDKLYNPLWHKDMPSLISDYEQGHTFAGVSEKIRSLISTTNHTDRLLDLQEKQEELQRGFVAMCCLYQIGLRQLDQVKVYAKIMKERYDSAKEWLALGHLFVEQEKIDEALDIFKEHVNDDVGAEILCSRIVDFYCAKGLYNAAIDLIKKYFIVADDFYSDACCTILYAACQTIDLSAAERVIDKLLPAAVKGCYILKMLKELQLPEEQTKPLVTKYQTILDQYEFDSPDTIFLIQLYVGLGDVERAWSTAKKKNLLKVLSEAFENHGLTAEKEKVEKLINRKSPTN